MLVSQPLALILLGGSHWCAVTRATQESFVVRNDFGKVPTIADVVRAAEQVVAAENENVATLVGNKLQTIDEDDDVEVGVVLSADAGLSSFGVHKSAQRVGGSAGLKRSKSGLPAKDKQESRHSAPRRALVPAQAHTPRKPWSSAASGVSSHEEEPSAKKRPWRGVESRRSPSGSPMWSPSSGPAPQGGPMVVLPVRVDMGKPC